MFIIKSRDRKNKTLPFLLNVNAKAIKGSVNRRGDRLFERFVCTRNEICPRIFMRGLNTDQRSYKGLSHLGESMTEEINDQKRYFFAL